MADVKKLSLRTFDSTAPCSVVVRRLPHWSQAGTLCFITWRTWDSMPRYVLESWLADRAAWLKHHGIEADAADCRAKLYRLDPKLVVEYEQRVSDRWNEHLDECHGACVLRRPDAAQEVASALRYFDEDRYELTDLS